MNDYGAGGWIVVADGRAVELRRRVKVVFTADTIETYERWEYICPTCGAAYPPPIAMTCDDHSPEPVEPQEDA